MATTNSGASLSAPRITARSEPSKPRQFTVMAMMMIKSKPLANNTRIAISSPSSRRGSAVAMAAPDKLSEKVAESIKEAEQTCSENPASGECVAAWDNVEELSAAASHARDRKKATNPLEEFCKDNPEDEECRTYED